MPRSGDRARQACGLPRLRDRQPARRHRRRHADLRCRRRRRSRRLDDLLPQRRCARCPGHLQRRRHPDPLRLGQRRRQPGDSRPGLGRHGLGGGDQTAGPLGRLLSSLDQDRGRGEPGRPRREKPRSLSAPGWNRGSQLGQLWRNHARHRRRRDPPAGRDGGSGAHRLPRQRGNAALGTRGGRRRHLRA